MRAKTTARTRGPIVFLALRGLSCARPAPRVAGLVRELRFTVPGGPVRQRARITDVRRSNSGVPGGFKIGAVFVKTGAATAHQIADFVSKSAQH
jgi:hypothetical protein